MFTNLHIKRILALSRILQRPMYVRVVNSEQNIGKFHSPKINIDGQQAIKPREAGGVGSHTARFMDIFC